MTGTVPAGMRRGVQRHALRCATLAVHLRRHRARGRAARDRRRAVRPGVGGVPASGSTAPLRLSPSISGADPGTRRARARGDRCSPNRRPRSLAEAFVATASATSRTPGVSFVEHDATTMPLPVGTPDLIYARLLLAHLPDPTALDRARLVRTARHRRSLVARRGGVGRDREPVLPTYLDEVAIPVVTSQGGRLIVGPNSTRCRSAERRPGPRRGRDAAPTRGVTARMFGMNLQVLAGCRRDRPSTRSRGRTRALASGERVGATVVWRMRQIAFERR